MQRILIIGPAYPLRGGLATFNQRLAQEFVIQGDDCSLISFSLQYPSLFFPGKTQYSEDPPPEKLSIHSWINSINPANWVAIGKRIQKLKPHIIIVRFWIPYMGPSLGTILRLAKNKGHTKIICIADNVIPHEHRLGDRILIAYFLKTCDAFITMSDKVMKDLRTFEKKKPALLVQHPLYDTFGAGINKEEARKRLGLPINEKIVLFFGFIRNYKGLDLLLESMSDDRIKKENIKLLIAGEFYEDEKRYLQIIKDKGISETIILRTHFIPDSEVRFYLCAADTVVQPYRSATQSGVTPLAYHFEKPMIVTNVGGLPSLVPHLKCGLVCEPNPLAIADAILQFYQLGEDYFIPHLRTEKVKYSWANLVMAVKELAANN
jgi:glycosyltransferase involved in cell wall biosynthesis